MYSTIIKTIKQLKQNTNKKTQGSMDWCRNIFICIVALIENLLDSYFSTRLEFGVNNEMILRVAAENHIHMKIRYIFQTVNFFTYKRVK